MIEYLEVALQRINQTSVWHYFGLVYLWSWLCLIPAVLLGLVADEPLVVILRILAGIGPMVVAVGLVIWTQEAQARREYWQRLLDPRRIRLVWYFIILLVVPLLTGVAAATDRILGGVGASLEARFQANIWGVLPLAILTIFFGPLPEEMGWRGYALDRLQERRSALRSSLILGGIWALWHLPLFFIAGTYQHGLGFGTARFWVFMLTIPSQTIFFTWIYNHNNCSTLSAVLFHFMINFVGELFALSARADLYQAAVWAIAAIPVVVFWGQRTLTYRRGRL